MPDGLNSVYGKKAGSGASYILPNSQAIGVYTSGIADQRERQRLLDAAALKRQNELADDNAKALGSLSLDDHWGERSAELQKDYDAVMDYATKATQAGKNINTDREFLKMKSKVKAKAGATKDLQHLYEQNFTEVGKNPDSYENGIDVLKSIRGASIDDFTSGKFKPEALRKIYSLADAVKESNGEISYVKNNDGTLDTTRVNRSGNVGQAIASLTTPSAKYLLQKAGGDTGAYVAGFPTITPDGKTYYNTEGKQFEDAVIQKLATDPQLPSYLQSKGYDVSSTDAIRKSAMDFAKKQNAATGKYIQDYADVLENRGTTDTTRIFSAEANRRANESNGRERENQAHKRSKWADEEFAKSPDLIATNVLTNTASQQRMVDEIGAGKLALDASGKPIIAQRQSTSLAATNVGNAKSSFLPKTIFNADTGESIANSASINVSGGQVHIKPVLRYKGAEKILDDESLTKLREGKYKLNGSMVPANTQIDYDELLYGEERIGADPDNPSSKASVKRIIIPVTGQALDKKFDKEYNRTKMFEAAAKAQGNFDDKVEIIKQYIKREVPGISEEKAKRMAFDTVKQY